MSDTALLDGAKLLYGLIYAIYRGKHSPVKSENSYFALRLGKEERQIRRYLQSLKDQKYVTIQYQRYQIKHTRRIIIPLVHGGLKSPVDTKNIT